MKKTMVKLRFKSNRKTSIECRVPTYAFTDESLRDKLKTSYRLAKGEVISGCAINESGDFFDFVLDSNGIELLGLDALNWDVV
jgi:hypothetical protein